MASLINQLSPHFTVPEIFGEHEPTEAQWYLAQALCLNLLEPIRKEVGTPLHITDGFRDRKRHAYLVKNGYSPYKYTDHSYLDELNPKGVGAADVLKLVKKRGGRFTRVAFTEEEYQRCLNVLDPQHVGQFIWYRKRGHFHVSNPRLIWWSPLALLHGDFAPQRAGTYIKEG
jgi:hypothetical protein